MKLTVISYHSVKGGVGKTIAALDDFKQRRDEGEIVYLFDLDFRGSDLCMRLKEDIPSWNNYFTEGESAPDSRIMAASSDIEEVHKILTLLNSEDRTAYMEAKVEDLFSDLLSKHKEVAVILDAPAGMTGLSRSLLSLMTRLLGKIPLSEDGYLSKELREAVIHWDSYILSSEDPTCQKVTWKWADFADSQLPKPMIREIIERR